MKLLIPSIYNVTILNIQIRTFESKTFTMENIYIYIAIKLKKLAIGGINCERKHPRVSVVSLWKVCLNLE